MGRDKINIFLNLRVQELYGMGARKFGVINVGQIGCAPLQRLQSPAGACADAVNALAAGFDGALRSLLAGLPHGLPGLAYSLGDLYGLMQATIADPRAAAGCPTWTPRAAAAACWAPRAAASPTRRCAPTAGATPLLGLRPPHPARCRAHRDHLLRRPGPLHPAGQLEAADAKLSVCIAS